MAQGLVNANRLLEELKAMGYACEKTVLKDFTKPLRPPRRPTAVLRFETHPEEQAQVDFGIFRYQDGAKTVSVAASPWSSATRGCFMWSSVSAKTSLHSSGVTPMLSSSSAGSPGRCSTIT